MTTFCLGVYSSMPLNQRVTVSITFRFVGVKGLLCLRLYEQQIAGKNYMLPGAQTLIFFVQDFQNEFSLKSNIRSFTLRAKWVLHYIH